MPCIHRPVFTLLETDSSTWRSAPPHRPLRAARSSRIEHYSLMDVVGVDDRTGPLTQRVANLRSLQRPADRYPADRYPADRYGGDEKRNQPPRRHARGPVHRALCPVCRARRPVGRFLSTSFWSVPTARGGQFRSADHLLDLAPAVSRPPMIQSSFKIARWGARSTGLLGVSFLSRFDLSIGRRDWTLAPKKYRLVCPTPRPYRG